MLNVSIFVPPFSMGRLLSAFKVPLFDALLYSLLVKISTSNRHYWTLKDYKINIRMDAFSLMFVSSVAATASALFALFALRQNEKTQKGILLSDLIKEESRLSCEIRGVSKNTPNYREPYLNFYDALGTFYFSGHLSKKDVEAYFKDMVIGVFEEYREHIYDLRKKQKVLDAFKNLERLYKELMNEKKNESVWNRISFLEFVIGFGISFAFIVFAKTEAANDIFNAIVTLIILSATLSVLSFTYYASIKDKEGYSPRAILSTAEMEFYSTVLYGVYLVTRTLLDSVSNTYVKLFLAIVGGSAAIFASGLMTAGIFQSLEIMARRVLSPIAFRLKRLRH